MKIVIAPDSFKGSLTAREAAQSIESGILKVLPEAECVSIPMADGGEGTVQSLVDATGGLSVIRRMRNTAFSVTAALRSSKWPRQAASNTSTRPRAIR